MLKSQVAGLYDPDQDVWYRKLVARKFDSLKVPRRPGRPRTAAEIEELVVQMARENRTWGYRRIVGAMAHLRIKVSHETVAAILKRRGLEPAPERRPAQ